MKTPFRLASAAWLLSWAAACQPNDLGGECATDSNCSDGQTCLLDVKSDAATGAPVYATYCTSACATDQDCSSDRACRTGALGLQSPESFCVERVRTCVDADVPNGLDDDCDGVADNGGLPPITRCLDDATCGGFVCRAPVDEATTVCRAPNSGPELRSEFSTCTSDAECRNGLCASGRCRPTCRFGSEVCPIQLVDSMERRTSCARNVTSEARPGHNLCQLDCETGACPSGTECVWRDVEGTGGVQHHFVCAELPQGRLPLGSTCPSNRVEDDLMCQHGLCFDFTCTRRCGGPGANCSDVGPDFECVETMLFYGSSQFRNFICVKGAP